MIYARYQDDGPNGPAPQCMSVTAPWDILFRCKDREHFDKLLDLVENNKGRHRRNPRLTAVWSDNRDIDGFPEAKDFI